MKMLRMLKYMGVLLLTAVSFQLTACDICGCSASGYGLGLLPGAPQHFIGLGYKYRSFETTHLTVFDHEIPANSKEFYQTYEAWGRYVPHPRIQLFGYVPYQVIRQTGEYNATNSGVGDAIVSGFWSVPIQKDSLCTTVSRRLLVGASSKLPTGKNDFKDNEGILLNENLQPGSGSWDAIYHLNYTEIHAKWGWLAEFSYRRNSQNKDYFRFGHRFGSNLRLFGKIPFNHEKAMLLPFVGAFYDNAGKDFDGVSYNEYSGGEAIYAQAGIDAVINQFGLRTAVMIPSYQQLGGTQINARAQLAVSLLYLF